MNNMGVFAIAAGVLGGVFAMLRWFAVRLLADMERRLARIEDVAKEVGRLDTEVKDFMGKLPLHYQRRDDAIREYTAINAKLDRQWEVMSEFARSRSAPPVICPMKENK
ncbi:hypothetical protein [Rhodoferax sp.]|uniref:hypothetical protein n=1 Tax=Rhodoferax sp. TaxID=50421 RepID=UPI00261BBA58|nr:hypothetical protein [Rhodoferax sp.]MDD3938031.1 hypothetical protein [Rhodoferax sp.]